MARALWQDWHASSSALLLIISTLERRIGLELPSDLRSLLAETAGELQQQELGEEGHQV